MTISILILIWIVLKTRMTSSKKNNLIRILMLIATVSVMLMGCGTNADDLTKNESAQSEGNSVDTESDDIEQLQATDNDNGSLDAVEESVDIAELQNRNSDVVGWLRIPGTSIDYPILQSWEEDDYYVSKNWEKQSDSKGALYIEMANMPNMCDFNTVIHGSAGEDGLFGELVNFENPDFFEANEEFKIFLDGNELTYEIWAVTERDNTSLIRSYDFSYISGCREFLNDIYDKKVMGKQIRGGWGDVDEYNFLVTLTADNPESDKQLIVIGALIEDKAGTIDRAVME